MKNRLLLMPAVLLARLLTLILKLTGRGSGTALPGLIVDRYFPFALPALVDQLPTVIAITGTNGKTTTQTMLNAILTQVKGMRVLRNQAGANLRQGILSQLLKQADWSGKLAFTHAIFEVEEATLPRIATLLRPDIIAVTNLYRDQLDAYGEIDHTEQLIRQAIGQCPQARVVVNGDDPRTSRLTQGLPNPTYFITLPDTYADVVPYEGSWQNTTAVTQNIVRAMQIQVNSDLSTSIQVGGTLDGRPLQDLSIRVASPGFFHIYNALSAIAIAKLLQVSDPDIIKGFECFQPAFGRGENLIKERDGKQVNYKILLVKNPASLSLSLDLLRKVKALKLIFAINDNTADSKDVSWLWDSQLEYLNDADIDWILCTGIRARDMKVRLKYAFTGDTRPVALSDIGVEENIPRAIDCSLDQANPGDTIYVLPTYTAMLEFRKALGKSLD